MAHYAKVVDGVVTKVIVAEANFFNDFVDDSPGEWIQTSFNTSGNVHYNSDTGVPDGGTPFRKNYAGIGFTWDAARDAFIPPKPYPSWTLNETTCLWECPVAHPDDGVQRSWNEETQTWDEVS